MKLDHQEKYLGVRLIVEIKTDDYSIVYNPDSSTIFVSGFLRLDGIDQYMPIMNIMMDALEKSPNLTINLEELEFLNSSGISTLSMFVVKVREKGNVQLKFQGSDKILWQTRSLKNLQRLMPSLKLEFI